jgi:hypothetical protein
MRPQPAANSRYTLSATVDHALQEGHQQQVGKGLGIVSLELPEIAVAPPVPGPVLE